MQSRRRTAAWAAAAGVFCAGTGATLYALARAFHDPGLIGFAAGAAAAGWAAVAAGVFGALRRRDV